MDFTSFNFAPAIQKAITQQGFSTPTPIQQEAIPTILSGQDVLGLAQTGTGKTAAYVLPLLQRLQSNPQKGIRALVLAPTRELAEQIHQVICELGRGSGLRSITVYGGVSKNNQDRILRQGVSIVVACPGRLLDHLRQRTIDLRKVEYLVLDEADQMFDMGFLPNIRQIAKVLPQQRQSLLFSATMPDELRKIVDELLREPKTIQIGMVRPAETISHALMSVEQKKKTPLLLELLRKVEGGAVLVFTKTKHQAKRLGAEVSRAGIQATSLQGNLSQNQRQRALDGFRSGKYKVLVATDVAARGIDVSDIVQVINYDAPITPESYTHRIGRTGRATRQGEALTFIGPDDMSMVRRIERILGSQIERRELEGFTSTMPSASSARPSNSRSRTRSRSSRDAEVSSYKKRPRSRVRRGANRPAVQ